MCHQAHKSKKSLGCTLQLWVVLAQGAAQLCCVELYRTNAMCLCKCAQSTQSTPILWHLAE